MRWAGNVARVEEKETHAGFGEKARRKEGTSKM